MEILGFALALIGFLIAAWLGWQANKQAEAADIKAKQLSNQLARTETRAKQVEAKAQALTARTQELEKLLAEAVARRDEKAMAAAMWELELERSHRQWRDVVVPDPTSERPDEVNAGQQLAFAIGQEVERLREEVGVSIRYEGTLSVDLEAETALGALRIVEELLALAAKRADSINVSADISVEQEAAVTVIVDCAAWIGDDPSTAEINATVQAMAVKLDGWVIWNREGDDHMVITVHLPVVTTVVVPPAAAL